MTQVKRTGVVPPRRTRWLLSYRLISFLALMIPLAWAVLLNYYRVSQQQYRLNDPSQSQVPSSLSQLSKSMEASGNQNPKDPSCKYAVRSVQDLKDCYPPQLVRPLPDACIHITEWKDVQNCLNGRFDDYDGIDAPKNNKPSKPRHFDVSLIGERNSGTKFLMSELQRCFRGLISLSTTNASIGDSDPPLTVKIHRDFLRHKHFFQPLFLGNFRERIVLTLFRDPIEWVAAMHQAPYHSPNHVEGYSTSRDGANSTVIPLPWYDFVQRPWSTPRSPTDNQILQDPARKTQTLQGETCLYRFSIFDVVPCVWDNATTDYPPIPDDLLRGYVPVYELRRDRSMRPYDHILELRSDKIVNFLIEIPLVYKRLGGYMAVRYEDMLRHGTRPVLEQLAQMMGLTHLPNDCFPSPPQPERLGRRIIPTDMQKWILEHVDPNLERLLGYNVVRSTS